MEEAWALTSSPVLPPQLCHPRLPPPRLPSVQSMAEGTTESGGDSTKKKQTVKHTALLPLAVFDVLLDDKIATGNMFDNMPIRYKIQFCRFFGEDWFG
jgi:hypothetical protein